MNEFILPVTALALCFGGLAAMYIMRNKGKRKSGEEGQKEQQEQRKTAQDFVNVRNIDDIFLHTEDNYLLTYVNVQPISSDLLTDMEKEQLARKLTDEFSQLRRGHQFLAVSRPIDIGPIVSKYNELISDSDDQVQKELLKKSIREVTKFSFSGEFVQREFYYILWQKNDAEAETELRKATKDLIEYIENSGLKAEILKKNEIIKLCNLFNNPAYATIEDTLIDSAIPFLNFRRENDEKKSHGSENQ